MVVVDASQFVFTPPPVIARARRVVIKPYACYPQPYPVTASWKTLAYIIQTIKQTSDADVIVLEGMPDGSSVYPTYQALGYDFPRALVLDVRDCIWVEVENPLPHPFALETFWVPNVIIASDFLISIAPFKTVGNWGYFTIANLLSLLPAAKYGGKGRGEWASLHKLGMDNVLADLYFTLPFDLGIIEGQQLLRGTEPNAGKSEKYGKIFMGEPYEIDKEACRIAGVQPEFMKLIEQGKLLLEEPSASLMG